MAEAARNPNRWYRAIHGNHETCAEPPKSVARRDGVTKGIIMETVDCGEPATQELVFTTANNLIKIAFCDRHATERMTTVDLTEK
jgi:hypothetical protein